MAALPGGWRPVIVLQQLSLLPKFSNRRVFVAVLEERQVNLGHISKGENLQGSTCASRHVHQCQKG